MRKRKQRSREQGRALVEAYRASGMSQAGYARANHIQVAVLRYWLKKIKPEKPGKKKSQKVRFVEMIPARDSREEAQVRLELNGIGSIQFRELPASEYLSSLISGITGNH